MTQTDDGTTIIYRLGMSLAIGLLVGVERHWHVRDAQPGTRTAGIRTFGLTGLLGGIAAAIGATKGAAGSGEISWPAALLVGICFLGFSIALLAFRLTEAIAQGRFGVTSVVAGQATFLLGAMAVLGDPVAVGATAVAMTAVLAAREGLHGFVADLTWPELRSAILLLSMTLVVLPLIPDREIAMLGGLNPAKLWLFTVLLAAVSFAGYLAERFIGQTRGVLASGAALGLVSSTAVTLTNARLAGGAKGGGTTDSGLLAAAALVAGATALLRTVALAWGVAPAMGLALAPALVVAAALQAAAGFLIVRRAPAGEPQKANPARNPFELSSVLQLAAVLAVVDLLAKAGRAWAGEGALYAVAAISGLADVDAITISLGGMAEHGVPVMAAATGVGIAVAVNTLSKTTIAASLGGRDFALRYGVPAVLSVLMGAALLAVPWQ